MGWLKRLLGRRCAWECCWRRGVSELRAPAGSLHFHEAFCRKHSFAAALELSAALGGARVDVVEAVSRQRDEREFFDAKSRVYDTEVFDAVSEVGAERIRRRAASIAAAAGVRPFVRALELGCGTGEYTREFAGAGASLVAVDVSLEMAKVARAKAPSASLVVADAQHLPFADGSFYVVLGNAVLHHLPDLAAALRETVRVLKRGGRAAFREPNLLSPGKFWAFVVPVRKLLTPGRWSPDERPFTKRAMVDSMRSAGYLCVEAEYAGVVVPKCPKRVAGWLYAAEARLAGSPLGFLLGSILGRGVRGSS